MITYLVQVLLKLPFIRKRFWRRWYQYLARSQPQSDWTFMNYGYISLNGSAPPVLEPEHESQRNWIQLYHHVASGADLADKDVLEVGSGRGGGAAYLHRYLKPKSYLGVDLARRAVDFCNRVHGADGLTFRQGDAEALPLPDESVDVVVNVESSHCYPNMPKFLGEVTRVLRPGGIFCYADLRGASGLDRLKDELGAMGLELLSEENIRPNVMAALREDNAMKRDFIRELAPRWMWQPLDTFAAVEGSSMWNGFESGELVYHHAVLRK